MFVVRPYGAQLTLAGLTEKIGASRFFGMRLFLLLLVGIGVSGALVAHSSAASQPGQRTASFGGSGSYIAQSWQTFELGNQEEGTKAWWWIPNTLKKTTTAPVVVYLHGFQLSDPGFYMDHIEHLLKRGNIVIFPQFNKTSLAGAATDTDQNAMLDRATTSTDLALKQIGASANRKRIILYGHSLGGLIAASWGSAKGIQPWRLVLASPSIDAQRNVPELVRNLIEFKSIDYSAKAAQTKVPAIFLAAQNDSIAKTVESLELASKMTSAACVRVYEAQSDSHGQDRIIADHVSPMTRPLWAPKTVLSFFGESDAEVDSLDYRYYYTALDAAVAGKTLVNFVPGRWSDGQPMNGPRLLAETARNPRLCKR